MYLQWVLLFPFAILTIVLSWILAPLVALFTRRITTTTKVKRLGKQRVTLDRTNLVRWLSWFQTHDNTVDEWWYGCYNENFWLASVRNWTQDDYDNSSLIRYFCRVAWLWRNPAYGMHYALFSKPVESLLRNKLYLHGDTSLHLTVRKSSFQLTGPVSLGNYYLNINIGWKQHKEQPRLLYASRIFSIRRK